MSRPLRPHYESRERYPERCTHCEEVITRPVGDLLARFTCYDGTPISAVRVMTIILDDLAAYASRVEALEQELRRCTDIYGGQVDHVS